MESVPLSSFGGFARNHRLLALGMLIVLAIMAVLLLLAAGGGTAVLYQEF